MKGPELRKGGLDGTGGRRGQKGKEEEEKEDAYKKRLTTCVGSTWEALRGNR